MIRLTTLLLLLVITPTTYPTEIVDSFWYDNPNLTTTLPKDFTKYFYLDNNIIYSAISDEEEPQTNMTYFPKCCPPGMNYNNTKRACYNSSKSPIYDDLNLKVNLIKSGLSDCDVVVDHLIKMDEFFNLIEIDRSSKCLIFGGEEFQYGSYCLDNVDDFRRILRVCYNTSYCDYNMGLICVQKCCADGEVMTYETNSSLIGCRLQQKFGFYKQYVANKSFAEGDFAVHHHQPQCTPVPILESPFIIDEEGILLQGELALFSYFMSPKNYCIETIDDNKSGSTQLYLCFDSSLTENGTLVETIEFYLRLSSLFCLIMVMVVYYFVYRLKKLIHMVVFSYCIASVIEQLPFVLELTDTIDATSFICFLMFSQMASCTWSNVMCYDIWHALRSLKQNIGHRKSENFRKMIYYSTYGWVLPLSFPLIYIYEVNHACILKFLHLKRKHLNTILFFLPLATFSVVDATCFTLTVCYIIRAKSNLKRLQDSDVLSRNKEIMLLYTTITIKLFLLMGVTNLISTVYTIIRMDDFKLQYNQPIFFQMVENVEGVIMFVILVFKWKCVKSIVKKGNIFSRYMESGKH